MEEPVVEGDEPVAEAVVEGTAAPEVEAAPEPSWSGPPQEEWEWLKGAVGTLSQNLAPPPVDNTPPGIDSYFPVDPETGEANLTFEALEKFVNDRANQLVESRLGQFEPVLNQTVADRGEQLINQEFEKLAAHGDFDRSLARELAEGYASSGYAPDESIRRGAQRARDFAQAQRQAGVEEYRTTLGNIGNAPREPGASGAGLLDDVAPEGESSAGAYKRIADNWVARNKLQ